MSKIIEVNCLNYQEIFKNLNISFEKNTFYSISGSNNSGKTTLIRILQKNDIKKNILLNNKSTNNYTIYEYSSFIKGVIPLEISFLGTNLEEEFMLRQIDQEISDYVLKGLKIKTLSKEKFKDLTKKEIVLIQIVLALVTKPKVLLLDSISNYLDTEDMKKLYKFLRNYQDKYSLTVISTTNYLEDSLFSDYLYILNNGEVYLEGKPLEVLEKDNILNKIGLNIPFMIDLSVKLRDYNLVQDIELDKDRMVDILWK